jgi:ParB family chromosome partitioning protein
VGGKKLGTDENPAARKPNAEKSGDIRRVEEELSDALMAQVEVRIKKRVKRMGKMQEMGELSIQFGSLDELNGLIDRLRGQSS